MGDNIEEFIDRFIKEAYECGYTNDNSMLYQYEHVPVSEVSKEIDRFIIPELQSACRSLWQRNIFTFMCSNREDGKSKYIILSNLSQENEDIFKSLMESDPDHYTYSSYRAAYSIIFKSDNVNEIIIEFAKLVKRILQVIRW